MKKEVLERIAKRLRYHSLVLPTKAGSGHPTSSLSLAEIITVLFFDHIKIDLKNPKNPNNDDVVLSKGHATPILWGVYSELGIVDESDVQNYRQHNSKLEGHPTPRMPWIKAATGSLGQGLSIGIGITEANRIQKNKAEVYVILGDGECAEGNIWEAAELASKRNTKITAIIDVNRLGQSGESIHGWKIKEWERKWKAFGWKTIIIDGHNILEIQKALKNSKNEKKPVAIIAKTIKGKGISFLENKKGKHGKPLNETELKKALEELGDIPEKQKTKIKEIAVKQATNNEKSNRTITTKKEIDKEVKDVREATRDAYGNAVLKIGKDIRVVALDGDVKNSTRMEKFFQKYPDRAIQCYIAEQNMIGIAVGLASKGIIPFASTFAAFLTRAHDQIRMAAISESNVKICGSHCGVSIGQDGPSQMGLEDLAMMRCLPGSVIMYPSDSLSTEKCTELITNHKGLSYIRTTRQKTPQLYKRNSKFKIGGSNIIKKSEKDKVLVITAGITLHETLKAYAILKNKGINIRIIDAYSIKPLDKKKIMKNCKGKRVFVIEDHYPEGGLGEAVSSLGIKITHICVKKMPRSATPEKSMELHGLDAKSIVKKIQTTLKP